VDNKHNLVVTHTINRNDLNALGAIAFEAKENLCKHFTVLMDKGYHNGRKLPNAQAINTTIVAHPRPGKAERSRNRIICNHLNTMQKTTAILAPKEKL
jgi:hypothetical protein